MDESLIRKLVSTIKCSLCGELYRTTSINVLGYQQGLWILNVFCPNCNSQTLVAAVIKEERRIEVTTDLIEAEYVKFARIKPFSVEDIQDAHNFLENFQGDISQLFKG